MNENEARLVDLPTSVRGFCYHDDDGEEYVILNSRLTWEQNVETFKHEKIHISNGDMYNQQLCEYGGF